MDKLSLNWNAAEIIETDEQGVTTREMPIRIDDTGQQVATAQIGVDDNGMPMDNIAVLDVEVPPNSDVTEADIVSQVMADDAILHTLKG